MSSVEEKKWKTKAGYDAVVLWVNDSHRCGYVRVPDEHSLYKKSYRDKLPKEYWTALESNDKPFKGSPVDVLIASFDRQENDGPQISYAINVHGGVTFSDQLRGYDGWWFGFDCAHAGDKTRYFSSPSDVERTLEFCVSECEEMAVQLRRLNFKVVSA